MPSVIWSIPALESRNTIIRYISRDNPEAAIALDNEFSKAIERIAMFPQSGRLGRVEGTKEVVVRSNYVLVYEQRNEDIVVLIVLHTAQQYPPEDIG